MTCKQCSTASYNTKCIICMARFILAMRLELRAREIEMLSSRFDIDELKAEIFRQHKKGVSDG